MIIQLNRLLDSNKDMEAHPSTVGRISFKHFEMVSERQRTTY